MQTIRIPASAMALAILCLASCETPTTNDWSSYTPSTSADSAPVGGDTAPPAPEEAPLETTGELSESTVFDDTNPDAEIDNIRSAPPEPSGPTEREMQNARIGQDVTRIMHETAATMKENEANRPKPRTVDRECMGCNGTGDCRSCGGNGYTTRTEYNYQTKSFDEKRSSCFMCSGNAKCRTCNGKGTSGKKTVYE